MAAAEWPFVGRTDELRQVRELVVSGDHHGAMLAGPPGVGKSRLAVECLRLAERAGFATLRATATRSAATLPFGAVVPLLAGTDRRPGAADDRADFLRRSASALVDRAGGRRLVILVDDAHLLDDASATLVHQLATAGASFVLVTVRTGEMAPDPVLALWKDGLTERVEVGGLRQRAMEDLLTAALGGPVDPGATAALAARSQGNILFLRELVIGGLDSGALVNEGGRWCLKGSLAPSNRLIELVEARLGGLDPAERSLLELVSYAETLGQAELDALADPSLAEVLERRALLSSRVDGRRLEIRLAHPLYGDVLRSRLPAVRERAIARSLAEAVEATGSRRPTDALRVARWRLAGGGGRPEVLLAGATAARWRCDHPLAERLARAALDAGAGFDAALLAAQVTSLQGRTDEAERELVALVPATTGDAQRGAVALARIHNGVVWTGYDRGGVIDEAEATVADPACRDQLAAARASLLFSTDGPRAAVDATAPLLERATGEARAWACVIAGHALGRMGRVQAALDAATRGHETHTASPTPLTWYPWWHTVTQCIAYNHAGRFLEAAPLVARHYQQALADRSTEAQAMFALLPAWAVGERGRVETAVRRACEALALSQELGRPVLARRAHIHRVLALALGGRAQDAADALAEYDTLALPATADHDVELLQARAWTAAVAGNLPEAHRYLERAADRAEQIGDLVGAAAALHGLARLGQAEAVRERLAAVADRIEGDLAPARAAHTDALAGHDAPGLEKVSQEFEAMGADLLAAEAIADAAVVRRRAGEMRAAVAAQHRAGLLVQRCEGAATPALQAIAVRVMLTAAERETALLAATGRSNRRIADELCLSVRTVENRLQRVYDKLGISRRTELTDALGTPYEPS